MLANKILASLRTWPLLNRNKVEDSNIEDTVRRIASSDVEELLELKDLANSVSCYPNTPNVSRSNFNLCLPVAHYAYYNTLTSHFTTIFPTHLASPSRAYR